MMTQEKILVCQCANDDTMPQSVKQSVLKALNCANREWKTAEDLCGLAAQNDPLFFEYTQENPAYIVACAPRAVKWLFHAAGAELSSNTAILNMKEMDADAILQALGVPSASCSCNKAVEPTRDAMENQWIPWFPVIDYQRCTNCKQCLNFCLFRVYELNEDDRVFVSNPTQCKNQCPACARVCPENAIIFPKHASPEINGSGEAQKTTQAGNDLQNLLKGDLNQILRQRNDSPQSSFPAMSDIAKAMEERKSCGCGEDTPIQIGPMADLMKNFSATEQPTQPPHSQEAGKPQNTPCQCEGNQESSGKKPPEGENNCCG
ncbi:hypothetical protein GF373_16600 [bacterium]|nr:hypothetical protein [bacterium]